MYWYERLRSEQHNPRKGNSIHNNLKKNGDNFGPLAVISDICDQVYNGSKSNFTNGQLKKILLNAYAYAYAASPTENVPSIQNWLGQNQQSIEKYSPIAAKAIAAEALRRIREAPSSENKSESEDEKLASLQRLGKLWSIMSDSGEETATENNESNDDQKISYLKEPLRQILEIDSLSSKKYKVMFPVVERIKENGETTSGAGHILSLTLTILTDSSAEDSRPTLALAPWSVIQYEDIEKIRQFLKNETLQKELQLDPNWKYLVKFKPVEQSSYFPRITFDGTSLLVAVLLAAWAAGANRELKRIVVTGSLDNLDDNNLKITGVDGVPEKGKAACQIAKAKKILFLYKANDYVNEDLEKNSPQFFEHYSLPNTIEELIDPEKGYRYKFLTDGFNELRESKSDENDSEYQPYLELPDELSNGDLDNQKETPNESDSFAPSGELANDEPEKFLKQDWKTYAKLIDQLEINPIDGADSSGIIYQENKQIHHEIIQSRMPFDNDPQISMVYHVRRILRRLSEIKNGDTNVNLTEYPVPLPLPLYSQKTKQDWESLVGAKKSQITQFLVEQINQGLQQLQKPPLSEGKPTVDKQVLHNILSSQQLKKICFVVYGKKSSEYNWETEKEVLKTLYKYFKELSSEEPTVFFIASDLHHAKFLENNWALKTT